MRSEISRQTTLDAKRSAQTFGRLQDISKHFDVDYIASVLYVIDCENFSF